MYFKSFFFMLFMLTVSSPRIVTSDTLFDIETKDGSVMSNEIKRTECSLCDEFARALNSGNLTMLQQILEQNETEEIIKFVDPEEGTTVLMTAAFRNNDRVRHHFQWLQPLTF